MPLPKKAIIEIAMAVSPVEESRRDRSMRLLDVAKIECTRDDQTKDHSFALPTAIAILISHSEARLAS